MTLRSKRAAQLFELPLLVAALLVVPVIVVEESGAGEPWRTIAGVVNWTIWAVFAAEVVVMLALVRDRSRWLREHPLEVAIVVLTPPFLPASLQALRVFRLLRLLRLVFLARLLRRVFTLEGLRYAAVLATVTVLAGGAAFSAVERGHNEQVSGTWDGVWWAVSTMTTVGYGDVAPMTSWGRVIAIVLMVVGIGFTALLTGAVAERFLARDVAAAEVGVEQELEAVERDLRTELREIMTRLQEIERRL